MPFGCLREKGNDWRNWLCIGVGGSTSSDEAGQGEIDFARYSTLRTPPKAIRRTFTRRLVRYLHTVPPSVRIGVSGGWFEETFSTRQNRCHQRRVCPKATMRAELTADLWKRQPLMSGSYCNRGTNSAPCNGRPVICRLLSKDGREIPCLCIL